MRRDRHAENRALAADVERSAERSFRGWDARRRLSIRDGSQSTPSLSLYLQEIQRVPRLPRDEALALAREVRRRAEALRSALAAIPEARRALGEDACAGPAPSDTEPLLRVVADLPELGVDPTAPAARRVARAAARHRRAKERLVLHHLRLVVACARGFEGRGVPLVDLIQEGNLGLMQAADRFDPDRGAGFSTCAVWWIRKRLERATREQPRTVRLPSHVCDLAGRFLRTREALRTRCGREPSRGEIAVAMGISGEAVDRIAQALTDCVSLDAPPLAPGADPLRERLADPAARRPDAGVARRFARHALEARLAGLDTRERHVLGLRFGLGGRPALTLRETGRVLGLSAERVRQLEERALERLRRRPELAALVSSLEAADDL